MLILQKQYIGMTVVSVQSGMPCGKVSQLIIDPNKLSVALIGVLEPRSTSYLLPTDVRFMSEDRMFIDAEHKLSEAEDLLRHQDIIKDHFTPVGCKVVTESRKRLGKVSDYALDDTSWLVEKLYVGGGILANPLLEDKIISRADVVNVNKGTITVRDLANRAHKPLTIPLPKNVA